LTYNARLNTRKVRKNASVFFLEYKLTNTQQFFTHKLYWQQFRNNCSPR